MICSEPHCSNIAIERYTDGDAKGVCAHHANLVKNRYVALGRMNHLDPNAISFERVYDTPATDAGLRAQVAHLTAELAEMTLKADRTVELSHIYFLENATRTEMLEKLQKELEDERRERVRAQQELLDLKRAGGGS